MWILFFAMHIDAEFMQQVVQNKKDNARILFKNENIMHLLSDIRIGHAKGLLSKSNFNITERGSLCGFSSASHFSAVFKKKMGFTPSEFRGSQGERYREYLD